MKYSRPLEKVTSDLYARYSAKGDHTRSMAAELIKLAAPVGAIEKMATTRNPMDTDAAHAKKVAQASAKLRGNAERAQERMTQMQVEAINRINDGINTRARLTPTADAAEIRTVLRSMPSGERMKAVNKAVKSGDAATLAAIAEGSELTTGLDNQMKTRFLDSYRQSQAPELFAELEELAGLSESIPSVLDMAFKAADAAANPSFIAEIAEQESAAMAAAQDFESSVSQ